jgi:lipopolysaccharide export LptBFGC system permease protein LptF
MRIQRYILSELLAAFALVALIVTGVLFAALMLQFLHRYPELDLFTVLRATPYIVPTAFPITLPLSFLVACLLTYGRFTDDNEFLALQMGGIRPWHAASPAIAVSAVLAVGTVLLNTDVIPLATLAKKEIARGEIRQLLRAIEDPGRESITLGGLQMSWRGRDPSGLRDVLITRTAPKADEQGEVDSVMQRLQAGHGRIDVTKLDRDLLLFDLDDVEVQTRTGERVTHVVERNQVVAIPIDELAGVPPALKSKGSDEMSGAQLWYKARRLREIQRTSSPSAEERLQMLSYETEYWRRIALGMAPLAFAFVGVSLGLAGGRSSRMAAFLTAVLVALPVYYPLLLIGANLARKWEVPAAVALNLGNIGLVAGGFWKFRRVSG